MLEDWDGYELVERDTWADGTPVSDQPLYQRYDWLMLNRPVSSGGVKTGQRKGEKGDEEPKPETGIYIQSFVNLYVVF